MIAIFEDGQEFGGVKVSALTPPRLNLLMRRGNVLVSDTPRDDQDENGAMLEAFFVLSRSKKQLVKLVRTGREEWDQLIAEFAIGAEDGVDEFYAALMEQLNALGEAFEIEPVKEPAVPGKAEASSHKETPDRIRTGSTDSPPLPSMPVSAIGILRDSQSPEPSVSCTHTGDHAESATGGDQKRTLRTSPH